VTTKSETYRELLAQAQSLFEEVDDPVANAANLAALLWHGLPDVSWAGFYFRRGDELMLGPFQGKPACVRIGWGRGVCGTAAARNQSLVVPDVHAFEGHIACDAASNSELVVPIVRNGDVIGVIDLDSASFGRFDAEDAAGIEALACAFVAASH
jgi:GAF domain-containing protein